MYQAKFSQKTTLPKVVGCWSMLPQSDDPDLEGLNGSICGIAVRGMSCMFLRICSVLSGLSLFLMMGAGWLALAMKVWPYGVLSRVRGWHFWMQDPPTDGLLACACVSRLMIGISLLVATSTVGEEAVHLRFGRQIIGLRSTLTEVFPFPFMRHQRLVFFQRMV